MKKLLTALCLLLSVLTISAALADSAPMLCDVTAGTDYTAKLTKKLTFVGEGLQDHYRIQQGAGTDGTYGYFFLLSNPDAACAIFKVDLSDWSIVNTVYNVPVEHGNDLTYNPNTGELIAVHCMPTRNRLSFIDPDTLAVTRTLDLPIDMCSLSYNAARDQYVIGHYDNRHFSIADSEFNILATYDTAEGTFHNQGSDCDDQYIYLLEWDKSKLNANSIVVYDWDGNYVATVVVKSMQEIEAIFHTEDKLVIALNAQRSDVCEATISVK